MGKKICTKCHESQPLENFDLHGGFKDQRNSRCKRCRGEYASSRWRSFSKERKKKESTARRKSERKRFLAKINMTPEMFEEKVKNVCGKCEICGLYLGESLCADHDHESGEFRGLLCKNCNMGIGMMKDSPTILQAAIEYLRMRGREV